LKSNEVFKTLIQTEKQFMNKNTKISNKIEFSCRSWTQQTHLRLLAASKKVSHEGGVAKAGSGS
jgi:hypothetical protein